MKYSGILIGLIFLYSCEARNDNLTERELNKYLDKIDKALKKDSVIDSEIEQLISNIEGELSRTIDTSFNGLWTTKILAKYNSDSSIILISSFKEWKDGFKREKLLHFNDTILLIKQFSVLTENHDTLNYELIDKIEYLTASQNIRMLLKRLFPAELKDSITLRQSGYQNFEDEQLNYSDKILYTREILRWN